MNKELYLIVLIVLIFLIKIIPNRLFLVNPILIKIRNLFLLVPTVIHEVIHLIGSRITGGKPQKLTISPNLSGLANFKGTNFSNFFATLVGYPGTSLFSLGAAYLYLNYSANYMLYIFIGFSFIATYYMRSWFTFFWLIPFNVLLVTLVYYDMTFTIIYIVGFLIASCIVEAFISSLELLIIVIRNYRLKNDSDNDAVFLKDITNIPAILWALLFFFVGLKCFVETIQLF